MAKLNAILATSQYRRLEILKESLKKQDYKLAGKLFAALRTICLTEKLNMKLDNKGRITKVCVTINGEKCMAKPIIRNNKVMFFYKKNYYNTEEVIGRKVIC